MRLDVRHTVSDISQFRESSESLEVKVALRLACLTKTVIFGCVFRAY